MTMMMEDKPEIAIFDVETTMPLQTGQAIAILEFGSILVCPRKLEELRSYSTLVRPLNPSLMANLTFRRSGITPYSVQSAPTFSEIADTVFDILNGRVWAGHNILRFDCPLIEKAFVDIGRHPPKHKGIIDSLDLLTQKFGVRAGDMKMASLANYFGLGEQKHRSLDDVRMNLEVIKYCATVLFLESSPKAFPNGFSRILEPDEVSISSVEAALVPFYDSQKMILLHQDVPLQLCCQNLKVTFGIDPKYAGRSRLTFLVEASPRLCEVLEACNGIAQKMSEKTGTSSEWINVVKKRWSYYRRPAIRLIIPTSEYNGVAQFETEIYKKDPAGNKQKLVFSSGDATELDSWLKRGTVLDACFTLEPYDFCQHAGIRLVAK